MDDELGIARSDVELKHEVGEISLAERLQLEHAYRMPSNFEWVARKNGDVAISHLGKHATTIRGRKAEQFLADIADYDEQELMARLTGNYKRGNERQARQHPRNH